jgi:hypothetical protein
MVGNIPCDNCNFKMGQLTCWHFGKMTPDEIHNRVMQGCDYHHPWWTLRTIRMDLNKIRLEKRSRLEKKYILTDIVTGNEI